MNVILCVLLATAAVPSNKGAPPPAPSLQRLPEVAPQRPLPFIHDDYAQALAQAKATGRPLFVDVWAPWCHTCRFMNAVVFSDPALQKHVDKFVWLSIDTENPINSGFVEKFPTDNWPSYLVLPPGTEKPLLKWLGAANVAQLEQLFKDGARAVKGDSGSGPESLMAQADRLSAERKFQEAADTYEKALTAAGRDWPRRSRAVEALAAALFASKSYPRCAEVVRREVPELPRGASFANASLLGLSCALALEPSVQVEAVSAIRPLAAQAVQLPNLLADDRSSLYEALTDSYLLDHRVPEAKGWATKWLAFLEAEQQKAPTPAARMASDPHLALAAQRAGHPERAIQALLRSERDLPTDYNAPARLALLYRTMKDYPNALATHDRALSKAYGPRRVVLLEQKGQTQLAMKDVAGARRTAAEARVATNELPVSQRGPAEKALARLEWAVGSQPN